MIELIDGLPEGVVGFEAVGEVRSDDYAVVAAAVDRARATSEKIRLLHVIGEGFTGHTASALLEDARIGLSHVRSIDRIAVVTDLEHFRRLAKGVGWSIPGELRIFSNAQRTDAIAWVSEGF